MGLVLCSKIWLANDRGKVFGDGPCELLEKVEGRGSLRKAAADMKMSYRQAWDLIKMLEENLGVALLERQAGGRHGGGSSLTGEGRKLMFHYKEFRHETSKSLQVLFDRHFDNTI